ncbi:MAG: CPBP family intramembrane glutamic endopeptidase [Bacteroidota bacterium]
MFEPTFVDHLFFVLVGVYLPLSNLRQARQGMEGMTFDASMKVQIYYINGMMLWLGAFIALGIWWANDRPLMLLGFRPPVLNLWVIGLTIFFVLAYLVDLYRETQFAERRRKTIEHWKKHTPFLPENVAELQHFNFLAISAGIAEEIVFRGFFITYWLSIFGQSSSDRFWAVLIPALIFSVGHSYQGLKAVVKIFVLAVLFGYLFLLSESLWLVMLLHVAVDMISGRVMMEVMMAERDSELPNAQ